VERSLPQDFAWERCVYLFVCKTSCKRHVGGFEYWKVVLQPLLRRLRPPGFGLDVPMEVAVRGPANERLKRRTRFWLAAIGQFEDTFTAIVDFAILFFCLIFSDFFSFFRATTTLDWNRKCWHRRQHLQIQFKFEPFRHASFTWHACKFCAKHIKHGQTAIKNKSK